MNRSEQCVHDQFIMSAYVVGMRTPSHPRVSLYSVLILALAALAWSEVAVAQPAGSPPGVAAPRASFTLADAELLARHGHPLLAAAGGRRLAMVSTARQEGAMLNPTVEWRRENLGSPLQRDEFVTVGLPLDAYGRRFALRAAATATAARALADSAGAARMVEYDIARAYWRAALALALRDAASATRAAVDTIANIEEERARQGAVPEGAALRARLEADRMRLNEASAHADAERARGDLARALAMPFEDVPQPTDQVRLDTGSAIPALAGLRIAARLRRPELVAARTRVTEAVRRQLAERLGGLPAVGFQVGGKRTAGYQTGTVGIGVTIPLFDRNAGGRDRARGDLIAAENELRALEASIDAEVAASVNAYRSLSMELQRISSTASGSSSDLRDLDARGRTVANIAAAAYREGAISLLELLDAVRARSDVRAASLRAGVDLYLARLDLTRAVGLPVGATSFLAASQ